MLSCWRSSLQVFQVFLLFVFLESLRGDLLDGFRNSSAVIIRRLSTADHHCPLLFRDGRILLSSQMNQGWMQGTDFSSKKCHGNGLRSGTNGVDSQVRNAMEIVFRQWYGNGLRSITDHCNHESDERDGKLIASCTSRDVASRWNGGWRSCCCCCGQSWGGHAWGSGF